MDTTTTTLDEDLKTQTTEQNTTDSVAETVKTDVPKVLREQLKAKSDEIQKMKAELDAIRQAEADKTKTAEEKLAEKELKLKEYEDKMTKAETYFNLERKLLTENINPELSDLINSKAKDLLNTNSNIEEVVEMLKSSYPTAFSETIANKPIAGKVGLSATTGTTTNTMTKEKAIELLNSKDSGEYLKHEAEIAKALYS